MPSGRFRAPGFETKRSLGLVRPSSVKGRNRSSSIAADSDVPFHYALTCGRVRVRVTGDATGAFSASLRARRMR